jgi:coenzyme PQQ precursor peptide PqqA
MPADTPIPSPGFRAHAAACRCRQIHENAQVQIRTFLRRESADLPAGVQVPRRIVHAGRALPRAGRPHPARGRERVSFRPPTTQESTMHWTDPAFCDIRLGFEVTAYVYVR